MLTLHFQEHYKDIPSDWMENPELKEGAEKYFAFLVDKDKKQVEFNKEHPHEYYLHKETFPIVEEIFIEVRKESGERKSVKFKCLEEQIGWKLYLDWKWNTPEVQSAYTNSRVAGQDWYKQFESNPDGRIDYLDNLKDRNRYGSEFEKIESAIKGGKHENR